MEDYWGKLMVVDPAGLINNFIKILNVVYVINCLWQLDPWKNTGASGWWVFSTKRN